MRCDTCHGEAATVMRVVVAKGYNRALARPLYNCPACFDVKERQRAGVARQADSTGRERKASAPQGTR